MPEPAQKCKVLLFLSKKITFKLSLAFFLKKNWANPGLFYRLFMVFSTKHPYNFTTNICEKMSIQ